MTTRPLDRFAAALTLVLCIVWGFNQVVAKAALPEIGPIGFSRFGKKLSVFLWAGAAVRF